MDLDITGFDEGFILQLCCYHTILISIIGCDMLYFIKFNFKLQEPFPHHAVEHGKSEWDSGTL